MTDRTALLHLIQGSSALQADGVQIAGSGWMCGPRAVGAELGASSLRSALRAKKSVGMPSRKEGER